MAKYGRHLSEKVLRLFEETLSQEKFCSLREEWEMSEVEPGDIVHITGTCIVVLHSYSVSFNSQGLVKMVKRRSLHSWPKDPSSHCRVTPTHLGGEKGILRVQCLIQNMTQWDSLIWSSVF